MIAKQVILLLFVVRLHRAGGQRSILSSLLSSTSDSSPSATSLSNSLRSTFDTAAISYEAVTSPNDDPSSRTHNHPIVFPNINKGKDKHIVNMPLSGNNYHLHPRRSLMNTMQQSWELFGNNTEIIAGNFNEEFFGMYLDLSADGTIVAVGSGKCDGVQGCVKVFKLQENNWAQIGAEIYGKEYNETIGEAMSLSADGYTVAVGSYDEQSLPGEDSEPDIGHVRVYEYSSNAGGSWNQIGGDITGSGYFGRTISLSADGNIVLVGAHYADTDNGVDSGRTQVYKYTPEVGQWDQLGGNLDGETAGDWSGITLSISPDGNVVAIGAIRNAGSNNYTSAGHIRVYRYNSDDGGQWDQLGADIDGEAEKDYVGRRGLALSEDGSIVAIGVHGADPGGERSGKVRVLEYNSDGNGQWSQIGGDINGEHAFDYFGWSVALSTDGHVVAVGAPYHHVDGNTTHWLGNARVFEYKSDDVSGQWDQLGNTLFGEAHDDRFGSNVALSMDGSILALTSKRSTNNFNNSGSAHVYEITTTAPTTDAPTTSVAPSVSVAPTSTTAAPSVNEITTTAPTTAAPTIGRPPNACLDSILKVVVGTRGAGCAKIVASNMCISGFISHCPESCNACAEFGCADSTQTWLFNRQLFTCAELADLDESIIQQACGYKEIYSTCRELCNTCYL